MRYWLLRHPLNYADLANHGLLRYDKVFRDSRLSLGDIVYLMAENGEIYGWGTVAIIIPYQDERLREEVCKVALLNGVVHPQLVESNITLGTPEIAELMSNAKHNLTELSVTQVSRLNQLVQSQGENAPALTTNRKQDFAITSIPMLNQIKRSLKVFLCHSSGDKPAVRDLYNRLRSAADYISPWLDEEDLLPGQRWEDEIPRAVRGSDVVLVCLSRESVTKSGYVQKEIKDALDVADRQPEGTIFLIPARLEECEIPDRLRHLHYVNLFEERGFERLIRALASRAEKLGVGQSAEPKKPSRSNKQVEEATSEGAADFPINLEGELKIIGRQVGDVTILDMSGKITIGEGNVTLRRAIGSLLKEGKKKILLNLEGVSYIDSSGIGELVSSYTLISRNDGGLKLLKLARPLKDLLAITKLLSVFDTYEDEAEALKSFR